MLNNPPPENRAICDNVEKYRTAEQASNDSMAHAHGMLGT